MFDHPLAPGTAHPKINNTFFFFFFALTGSVTYPSGLCELSSFGDVEVISL